MVGSWLSRTVHPRESPCAGEGIDAYFTVILYGCFVVNGDRVEKLGSLRSICCLIIIKEETTT